MTEIIYNFPIVPRSRRVLIVALLPIVAALIGCIFQPRAFARAYLFAYVFWLAIPLGSMALVMLHHLTGGDWGLVIRRIAEAAMMTLPLMTLLFLPIAFTLRLLYPWADPARVSSEPLLTHKAPYLNAGFFLIRAAVYFLIWNLIALRLRRISLVQDRDSRASPETEGRDKSRPHNTSALGLLLYFLTMSLASVDWIMSLDPAWYSTIFGMVICAAQALSAFSFILLVLMLLADRAPFSTLLRPSHLNDLGNLLLTIVILWAYLAFAQFLVHWLGNTQEDIPWYIQRLSNGWRVMALLILLFHFFLPFLVLLSQDFKRSPAAMLLLCALLLFMRAIDVYWLIAPSGDELRPLLHTTLSWLDFIMPLALAGPWLAAFLLALSNKPLIPTGETVKLEALPHVA